MNNKQHDQSTDLILAVKNGQLLKVKELLGKGCNPNSSNDNKTAALSIAIIYKQLEICSELLKAGANPHLKNTGELSPLDIAYSENAKPFIELIQTFKFQNKEKFRKPLFEFKDGQNTKRVHIEYNAFPRTHKFEYQYYKDTIELLQDEIEEIKNKVRKKDVGGVDARSNDILANHFSKKIPQIEQQKLKPYYARLDIKYEKGYTCSYYIGSRGMKDDRVYAPQTRLGSLYAQKKFGKVTDSELGNIEITLIRQIENENGQILQIIDKEWTEEEGYIDTVLLKHLNDSAKTKMNEIWETIQAEQDIVVRQGIGSPIIIQGSAGSGKTVIALHRLSYLLFHYKEKIEEQKIMILGPNLMYLKYIQDALPNLDVGNIEQTTFEKFCMERIPFEKLGYSLLNFHSPLKKGLTNQDIMTSKIKGALYYQKALKKFLDSQIESLIPKKGISLSSIFGEFSISVDRIKKLFIQATDYSSLEVARDRVIKVIQVEINRNIQKMEWEHSSDLNGEKVKQKMYEEFKGFINNWKIPNAFELYRSFSTNTNLLKDIIPEEYVEFIEMFAEENKKSLDNSYVTIDDLPALLEIEGWLTGKTAAYDGTSKVSISNKKFHYVLIDEAQDFSPYQLSVIQSLVMPGRLMLLGDLGQSIYGYRGITNWSEAVDALHIDNPESYTYLELSTIYRSTIQIVQFANEIIRPFTLNRYTLSEPIGRDGVDPEIEVFKGKDEQLNKIITIINQLYEQEYENIAVITRDWDEAASIYDVLKQNLPDLQLVTEASNEYKGGVIVVPVYLTKGIEFDAVILADASMEKYKDNDDHRKLLYVSVTRALHQVFILFDGTLSLPLLDIVDKEKADIVREEIKRKEQEAGINLQGMNSSKQQFLQLIEKEFDKVTNQHFREIEELKNRIAQLESELRLYKGKYNNQS